MNPEPLTITESQANRTLAAVLRTTLPGLSWSKIEKIIHGRRVMIDGGVCMDPARRLKVGEVVECLERAEPVYLGATADGLTVRHLDDSIVVVEKASGINTVRHPAEREWDEARRELSPTLEDITQSAIARRLNRPKRSLQRLRIVQRLDKDTSGLVVFARNADAERLLGRQFADHTVIRRYQTIIAGYLPPQTVRSWLVADRGDGRRGSGRESEGKRAVTHFAVLERLPRHTMLECRLETGRTHQIRIHLSEAGHPVCGEQVYNRKLFGEPIPDADDAPRLALHAMELGFVHPETSEEVRWEMELPIDLQGFLNRLRRLPPEAK